MSKLSSFSTSTTPRVPSSFNEVDNRGNPSREREKEYAEPRFVVGLIAVGMILHLIGYIYEPELVSHFPPPPVTDKLHGARNNDMGDVDYLSHPIINELERHRQYSHLPVVVYGPSGVGKSTCIMRLVEHLQNQGEHAIYIPLRDATLNSTQSLHEYVTSFLEPEFAISPPYYLNPRRWGDRIQSIFKSHAARGKPVRLFIDDAQMLAKESFCLGFLHENISINNLQVVYITNDDNKKPVFLKPNDHRTRYKTIRFEQDGNLVMDALKKSKYGDDERKLLVNSVGYAMRDILDVLSKLGLDRKLALSVSTFMSPPEEYRMVLLADKLAEGDDGIVSRVKANDYQYRYVWRTQAFATAFAKYASSASQDCKSV